MRSDIRTSDISVWRFALPIMIENTAMQLIGMVTTAVFSGISPRTLAAIGIPNSLISFLTALFSMMTTGASVIVSRYTGANDIRSASRTIEQTISLSAVVSAMITALVIALAVPVMRLLMPNAESAVFADSVDFLRVLMLSFPFLMVSNVLIAVLRAVGNTRAGMVCSTASNLVQLLTSWLFLSVWKMDIRGAGLTYIISRAVGMLLALVFLLRDRIVRVRLAGLLKPDGEILRLLVRVGTSTSVESTFVQGGYLIANALAMGLGTASGSAYQIVNTLSAFPAIAMNVCIAASMNVTGQHIGAKRYDLARRDSKRIWLACVGFCGGVGVIFALLGTRLTSLYTQDVDIAKLSAVLMWVQLSYQIFGGSINGIDPALRAGGELKFVLIESTLGVWLLRLPLSWLLGYKLGYGIIGVYAANGISLLVRAALGLYKYFRTQWIHEVL